MTSKAYYLIDGITMARKAITAHELINVKRMIKELPWMFVVHALNELLDEDGNLVFAHERDYQTALSFLKYPVIFAKEQLS